MSCFARHLISGSGIFSNVLMYLPAAKAVKVAFHHHSTHVGSLQQFHLFWQTESARAKSHIKSVAPPKKTMKPKHPKYDLSLLAVCRNQDPTRRGKGKERIGTIFPCLQPLIPHKQHLLPVLMSWSSPRLLPCFETPGHLKLQWTLTSFNYLLFDVVESCHLLQLLKIRV